MNYVYYPSEETVLAAKNTDEPILIAITFDGEKAYAAPLNETVDHHILLTKCGLSPLDIDKVFRIVVDKSGADWTFACPPDTKDT